MTALSAAAALQPGMDNTHQRRATARRGGEIPRSGAPAGACTGGGNGRRLFARSRNEAPVDGLAEAAAALDDALKRLAQPLHLIADRLRARLDAEAEDLDTATRIRMDAAARGIERRVRVLIPSWRSMLASLGAATPEIFVDWFSVDRLFGREIDTGMHRHWRDPSIPFAAAVLEPAHGVLITSATLRDQLPDEDDEEGGWESAEIRTGASHLALPATRAFMASPFDYGRQARVFVVRDVSRTNLDEIASAYRELFRAADGGALGLFTAIHRLRAVHERIVSPLEEAGLIALRTAYRCARHRHAGRHLPRGTPCLPARHRCGARRGGRAGRLAQDDRVRPRALAASRHIAQGAARTVRQGTLRRHADQAAAQTGLRAADPPRQRPGRLRDARFTAADTAHLRLPARHGNSPGGPCRSHRGIAPFPRRRGGACRGPAELAESRRANAPRRPEEDTCRRFPTKTP